MSYRGIAANGQVHYWNVNRWEAAENLLLQPNTIGPGDFRFLVNTGDFTILANGAGNDVIVQSDNGTVALNANSGVVNVNTPQANFSGNVMVNGSAIGIDSTITVADPYIDLGIGGVGTPTGGLNVVTNAVTAATNVQSFTGTQVTVASASGLGTGDIIQISGASNAANNGLFAVASVAGNVITIDTTPLNTPQLQNTFVTDATVAGQLSQVHVSSLRFAASGAALEVALLCVDDLTAWPYQIVPLGPGTGATQTATIAAGATASPTTAALEANTLTYLADSTLAGTTLALPATQPADGVIVRLKDSAGNAQNNPVVVNTVGGALIDGNATKTIGADYGSLTLQSNGIDWFVV